MSSTETKPLGRKAYGSIGHLPTSRMGPGDHAVHEGQARICCERVRDKFDTIIVQEKLDGSCVSVANVDGQIIPLGRAGWPAVSSPYLQHRLFSDWVLERWELFDMLLLPGERIVGEWLALAHGTRYHLAERAPFVAFDIMREDKHATHDELTGRLADHLALPHVIRKGPPLTIDAAMELLGPFGRYGAMDPVEGIVYRVERAARVDFLAKYVRPDKIDGCYLAEISGEPPMWNWQPQGAA